MALTSGLTTAKLNPQRYRQQPQGAVEIDWAHPLARGLVFFQIPSMQAAHDLVGNRTATVLGATTLDAGSHGRAIGTTSTSSDGWVTPYRSDLVRSITTDFTIATKVDITAITANSKIITLPLSSTEWTAPFATVQISRSSSSSQTALHVAAPTGTGRYNALFPANTFQVSNGNGYIVSKSGTTARLLYNRNWLVPDSSTLTTEPLRFGTGAEVALMNRMQAVPGEGVGGKMYYAAIWNRALSESEARDFEANPYQILKPMQARGTFAVEYQASAGTALGVLPKFGALASGQRLAPGIFGPSAASLPRLAGTAAATRAMPSRTATSAASLPKFGALAAATRLAPARTAASAATLPKFKSGASAVKLGPGFDSASASVLPRFGALAAATRTITATTATSAATLPKLGAGGTAMRSVDPRTATALGVLPRFRSSGVLLRSSIDRNAVSLAQTPKFSSTVAAERVVPPTATLSAATLPLFKSLAAAARTIPNRIAVSSTGLPRLRSSATVVSLPPPGTVVPVTVNHRRAPAWRLTEAGTGQSNLSFASALDPNGLTYFTIDWSTELNGSTDTIILDKDAIGVALTPSAVAAGLMIHAITFDEISITVWLKIQPDQQNAAHWSGTGESYTMNFLIRTMNGQIFNRNATVSVKQM